MRPNGLMVIRALRRLRPFASSSTAGHPGSLSHSAALSPRFRPTLTDH